MFASKQLSCYNQNWNNSKTISIQIIVIETGHRTIFNMDINMSDKSKPTKLAIIS